MTSQAVTQVPVLSAHGILIGPKTCVIECQNGESHTRLSTVGSCTFSVFGLSRWNDLPIPVQQKPSLDSFRSNLKHLFSQNYTPAMFSVPCCCFHLSQVCLMPIIICVNSALYSQYAYVCGCLCVCAYVLRIVSMDKICSV